MWKDVLFFWGLFLAFNYLQFLPFYIFNYKNADFLPYLDFFRGKKIGFFANRNPDIFRYVIDISVFVFVVKLHLIYISPAILSAYYIIIFIYNTYHFLFWTLYETYPTFYNDWSLLKTGLAILWKESKIKVISFSILGMVILIMIYFSFFWFLEFTSTLEPVLSDLIIAIIFCSVFIAAIWLYYIKKYKSLQYIDHQMRYAVGFLRIYYNIKYSIQYKNFKNKFRKLDINKIRVAPDFKLVKHPNIFFLFIESYGGVLLKHKELRSDFRNEFELFYKELSSEGLDVYTNLSSAPSTSAFSWLCYSSFFYGYNISQHTHYESFLKNPVFYESDNLMRILKKQGYTTCFLNPIQPNPNVKINYEYLTPFYAIDRWILYEDMDYSGHRYGFSEAPPDQYSLFKAREIISRNKYDPFVLFYLTKNSHSPFLTPEEIVDDWKSLNKNNGESHYGGGFLHRPTLDNYLSAIKYQLRMVKDFIIKSGNPEDLFFIVGDHQPPVISNRDTYGLKTLVHVISGNSSFLEGFTEYGFKKSLDDEFSNSLRHEALYSVFLREFMRCFGEDYTKLPPYEPQGLQI